MNYSCKEFLQETFCGFLFFTELFFPADLKVTIALPKVRQ